MRIVVIGASGQLGSDLMRAFADWEPVGVDHAMFDIESPSAISKLIARHAPDLIINTAAFHNVELCETRPDRALAVNALAVDQLAAQCAIARVALAHISTDYVFDGDADIAYTETARASPLSSYGISKLAGELYVRRNLNRAYVIRTSGLYGIRGSSTKGYTFIERILTNAERGEPLRVVTDITFSPSYTRDVASAVRAIVETGRFGTYHVTNSGHCTWYDFATEILRQAEIDAPIARTHSSAFPTLAKRPRFSALAHHAMENIGLPPIASWQAGITAYLAERSSKR